MAKTPSLFDDLFSEEDNLMPLKSSESNSEKSNLTSEPENEYEIENTPLEKDQIPQDEDSSHPNQEANEVETIHKKEENLTENVEKANNTEATEHKVKAEESKRSSIISFELPKYEDEITPSHDYIVSATTSNISIELEEQENLTSSSKDVGENSTTNSSIQIEVQSKQENIPTDAQSDWEIETPQEREESTPLKRNISTTNNSEGSPTSLPFLDIEILSPSLKKEDNNKEKEKEEEEDFQDKIINNTPSNIEGKSELSDDLSTDSDEEPVEEEEAIEVLPEWELSKNYYTIGEVAKMFNINISHIRFWTNEFKLKPRTNRKGDRLYSPEIIQELRIIHYLVKVKKHTIKGAIEKLKGQKEVVVNNLGLKESLISLRDFLKELRATI